MTRRLSARIAGFGHYAPERRVMNAELEAQLGLEAGWIERRTGIKERRWATQGEKLTDFAVKAGEMALSHAGVAREEVALTLLATSTPDHLLPPSAPLLAYRLGLTHSGAVDLAGACSGFLYALTLADGFVRTQGKAVLVVAANILSRRINPAERASAIVFADAAGAAVLVPSDDAEAGIRGVDLVADGSQYGLINIPAGGSQQPFTAGMDPSLALMTMPDGKAVFTQAVRMMVRAARRALEDASTTAADIDRFIPHQANVRIFEAVREQLGLPPEKTVQTIHDYGNSSAATIPLSLSLANQARPLAPGEQLLLTAAGAGMAGGAIVLRM